MYQLYKLWFYSNHPGATELISRTTLDKITISSIDCVIWRLVIFLCTLWWRHYGCDGVSNHQPHGCLLNRLFGRRSKQTSKLRVTGLCVGNSSGTGEFAAQLASNAENVSIWWRYHEWLLASKYINYISYDFIQIIQVPLQMTSHGILISWIFPSNSPFKCILRILTV